MRRTCLSITVVTLCTLTSMAGAGGTIQSDVSPLSAVRGDTISISVNVDSLTPPLGCFSFGLDYDPLQLRFLDAVEGALFTAAAAPTFFSVTLDTAAVEVVSDCVLGFGTSVVPPGVLAVLRFETLVDGVLDLSYKNVVLRDVDRASILPVSVDTVSVAVGATSVSTLPASSLRLVAAPNPSSGLSHIGIYAQDAGSSRLAKRGGEAALGLQIYDLAGRLVRSLRIGPGLASATWDGRDTRGTEVAGGIYFAAVKIGGRELRTKILRLDG